MMQSNKTFLLIAFLLTTIFNSRAQSYFDYESSLKFANYLFESKQYSEAAIEYERVLFLNPLDSVSRINQVKALRFSGNTSAAKNTLISFSGNNISHLSHPLAKEYCKLLITENDFEGMGLYLQEVKKIPKTDISGYMYGLFLAQSKWKESAEYRFKNEVFLKNYSKYNELYNVELKGLQEIYKKPWLATGLSMAAPGLGKVYSGQWKDAIYSFLFISAGGFLTYNSYQKNGFNKQTGILGGVTTSLYLVNIYGSFKSAGYYNSKKDKGYKKRVEAILLDE
ncbi:MAG: hypothetical protein JXA77_08150 [Bacteroidales bacterium]|nr:hypothetical protein [Bacteroidales bacterium]